MKMRSVAEWVAPVLMMCVAIVFGGCESAEPPPLSSGRNVIPPTRTFIDVNGNQVKHNWLELPAVEGTNPNHKFVTHYTTIGGKRVRNFTMLYDTDHRVALWVAYPLHACYLGSVGRTDEWAFDPQLPTSQQAQVANGYFGSPYQRGHQIPSADRLVNYEANAQTFYATNLTAQNGTLNSGMWADLEGFVRSKNCKDTLYVVTGCVVKEGGERRQGATVPTSYFKALLRTQKGSTGVYASDENAMCIAFLIDNKSNSGDVTAKHAISVATLEDMLGYELFPAISRSVKEQCTPSRWALK